jgi:hypothetical protein
LSERRHRLYTPEIPEVKRGLKLRLRELCEAREDREAAEIAFRALFCLSRDEPGRPKYPEFTVTVLPDNGYPYMTEEHY